MDADAAGQRAYRIAVADVDADVAAAAPHNEVTRRSPRPARQAAVAEPVVDRSRGAVLARPDDGVVARRLERVEHEAGAIECRGTHCPVAISIADLGLRDLDDLGGLAAGDERGV